jgi:hypothetical protein
VRLQFGYLLLLLIAAEDAGYLAGSWLLDLVVG